MTRIQPTRRAVLSALLTLPAAAGCKREPELPRLGTLAPFSLTNQDGKAAGSAELRGKVWAASFFFTRCPTVCPRLIAALREVQAAAKRTGTALHLVSFSVDPEYDTPAVLKAYATSQKADLATWTFLTGDTEVIKKTSVEGFKLAVEGRADAGAEHFGILHGSHVVLVDRDLTLRGYYRSNEAEERARLLADAARLLA